MAGITRIFSSAHILHGHCILLGLSKAAEQAQEESFPATGNDRATSSRSIWDAAHSHADMALQLWKSCSGHAQQGDCDAAQGALSVDLILDIGHLAALQVRTLLLTASVPNVFIGNHASAGVDVLLAECRAACGSVAGQAGSVT